MAPHFFLLLIRHHIFQTGRYRPDDQTATLKPIFMWWTRFQVLWQRATNLFLTKTSTDLHQKVGLKFKYI